MIGKMVNIEIPQRGTIELQHAVFDVNGTLAIDGIVIPGVVSRLKLLANYLSIHVLTAGTHGNLAELARALGYPLQIIRNGKDKALYVEQLGAATVIAFGNGVNDAAMLRLAAIGVAIITAEGIAVNALQAADVLASGPLDAIDLILKPKRLIATLRG